jgi:hypothetical protein
MPSNVSLMSLKLGDGFTGVVDTGEESSAVSFTPVKLFKTVKASLTGSSDTSEAFSPAEHRNN